MGATNVFIILNFVLILGSLSINGQRVGGGMQVPTSPSTDQCNKTVGIYEEVMSPPISQENYGKPMLCHYRFRPFRTNLRDWVLRIRFTKFKVGRLYNDSGCETGYIQIIDGNGKGMATKGRDPGKFCGEIEQSQTFISETSVVRIVFYVDNFTDQTYFRFDSRAEQQYEVFQRYGQHPELFPNRRGELVPNTYCERVFRDCRMQTCYVQSPGYPGLYPRNLHCKYSINTRLPFIKLHIENEEFNVDGQRCENLMLCPMKAIGSDHCPNDYIRIYDGKDDKAPIIGTFCGIGKFPFSIIGTGSDLFVEFVTSGAGPLNGNTGFHFQVGHWPTTLYNRCTNNDSIDCRGHVETTGKSNGTCDWIFTSKSLQESGDKQGLFWSVSHWYQPNTRCSYLMIGENDEIVRLVFPSFRIEKVDAPVRKWDGECSESLTIYDSDHADDSKIIKTFCDTSRPPEKYDFVSTSNALYVLFESKTGSYSGSSLYYWATYDYFNNTHYGDAVPNSCDEVFASWNKAEGKFTSPLNTLIYKNDEGKQITCKYRFVSLRRLYARVMVRIDNVNFKYNQDTCLNCWVDRVDKIMLIDPLHESKDKGQGQPTPTSQVSRTKFRNGTSTSRICVCKENVGHHNFPVTLVSDGEEAEITLKVDPRHSLANYFKSNVPIFEGSYKFIHGPLCGPTVLGPSADGKLRFPFYYNPALRDLPVSCLWELRVHPEKDLWINLEKLVFAISSKACSDAKLEFYLPKNPNQPSSSAHHQQIPQHLPLLTLCGDSNVGDRKTEISSQLPILTSDKLQQGGPVTIKLEASSASKLNFIISWTELHQLPRNPDGSLKVSKLEGMKEECGFICPGTGSQAICIERNLVCNGIQNCPNTTGTHDESPENCKHSDHHFILLNRVLNVSWVTASIVGGTGALTLCIICVCCCRLCFGGKKHKRPESPPEEDYLT